MFINSRIGDVNPTRHWFGGHELWRGKASSTFYVTFRDRNKIDDQTYPLLIYSALSLMPSIGPRSKQMVINCYGPRANDPKPKVADQILPQREFFTLSLALFFIIMEEIDSQEKFTLDIGEL